MRPTRRGVGVVAVLAFSFVMAWQYGTRSLTAIIFPLLVVSLTAVATASRTDEPAITRTPVEAGFIGEQRTVEIGIEPDTPISATIHDTVDTDGLTAEETGNAAETTIAAKCRFRYDVRLESRGEHEVGPLSIVVTDLLGLVKRRFEDEQTTSVLVFPRIYDLTGGSKRELQLLADAAGLNSREEFDHLREYVRGDSLRDVHWKSAAKRPDDELVVKEFVADEERGSASIAAECIPGREDAMATAVASVATYLLEFGVSVGVELPEVHRPPATGREHHRAILRSLAVVEAGELDERAKATADVLVHSDANGTVVLVDGHEIPFDRLRGGSSGTNSSAESGRWAAESAEPTGVRS
ncbi:hypothetical protein HALLA_18460 [Halostagnicola larsenii XH-48]|uniref:DUF58 domain-containing protein n=1 Tax=Halostagnicola larsenii XH-48 TaxID=797299 RepID=W0JPG6_9EURY|nr:DUF58 domain-containing protein [Halostagnicola larsenii]AHG00484.1 hypothetical protein HALLA_18460 [Halostagnicola larsenii XH-48]